MCISDYFGDDDTVAFQAVTVGKKVADLVEKWNKEDYTDAYYLHGFAVETAEALAEWTQRRIRTELGIGDSGLRYSWGFPSCRCWTAQNSMGTIAACKRDYGYNK